MVKAMEYPSYDRRQPCCVVPECVVGGHAVCTSAEESNAEA